MHRPRFLRAGLFAIVASLCVSAASCSIYSNYKNSRPANILELEARLERAGFHRVPIETPEQNGAVEQLPLYKLNRYDSANGSVFWYADPSICHCLYRGDQHAYQQYADILQQEEETAAYVNYTTEDQVAYLSPFGYAFPPPVLFAGWPLLYSSGGGGYYYRPPAVGPHPAGGAPGGSPIHSRGWGGGGWIHGWGGGSHGGSAIHGRR